MNYMMWLTTGHPQMAQPAQTTRGLTTSATARTTAIYIFLSVQPLRTTCESLGRTLALREPSLYFQS